MKGARDNYLRFKTNYSSRSNNRKEIRLVKKFNVTVKAEVGHHQALTFGRKTLKATFNIFGKEKYVIGTFQNIFQERGNVETKNSIEWPDDADWRPGVNIRRFGLRTLLDVSSNLELTRQMGRAPASSNSSSIVLAKTKWRQPTSRLKHTYCGKHLLSISIQNYYSRDGILPRTVHIPCWPLEHVIASS